MSHSHASNVLAYRVPAMRQLYVFCSCVLFTALSSYARAASIPVTSYPCDAHLRLTCSKGQHWDQQSCRCVPDLDPIYSTSTRVCPNRKCPASTSQTSVHCLIFKTDAQGCPTCECDCSELEQICPVNCPSGTETVTASNGCRKCRCRPDVCTHALDRCNNECPFGRLRGADGCPSCECKRRRTACPTVMCSESCPYGTFLDTNDCPSCVCKPKPICPLRSCDHFCPNGRMQDSNGCDSCACRPVWPEPSWCPELRGCETNCPGGYARDEFGCPVCRCKKLGHGVLIMSQSRR